MSVTILPATDWEDFWASVADEADTAECPEWDALTLSPAGDDDEMNEDEMNEDDCS